MTQKIRPAVKLVGTDGNAFAILGKVNKALKAAGLKNEASAFMTEAMSGDYDHLLQTAMKYVDVS
jgi:hypothetical protein